MKITSLLYTGLLTLSVTSCQLAGDIEDIKPYYKLESETVIRDAESAENVLRGVYEGWRLWGISVARPYMSILSGGLIRTANMVDDATFVNNNVMAEGVVITDLYRDHYRVINSVNNLIDLMEQGRAVGMEESRVKEIIAEAKIHRAYAHFQLLRHFGYFFDRQSPYGIVLRDRPFTGLEASARSTVEEAYTFILKDLDDAIVDAPKHTDRYYYMTATTAKAFKAKVLLHQGEFAEAEKMAKEVLDEAGSAGYALESDYGQVFIKGFGSSEALFATYNFGPNENASVSIERTRYSEYSRLMADDLLDGTSDDDLSSGEGYDQRFAYMYSDGTTGPNNNGKYPYGANVPGQRNTHFIMRLAEVYLIHAEAASRNGHYGEAKNSLQAIVSRAGYGDDYAENIPNDEMVQIVFDHKWIELLSENGEDWFDYVRYYRLGNLEINSIKNTIIRDNQLVLPIPLTALAGNNLLEKNP